jgi:GT2 family glycosyltransferase
MSLPRITIVTPSFNQGRFLEQTIRSVLDQGYPNLQYGVVDGGSDDGSDRVIARYRSRLDFVVIEPDRGQSDAINKGLKRADGDVLGWLNSDDTLLPGTLRFVGEHFRDHPFDNWISAACRASDADGRMCQPLRPTGEFTLHGALLRKQPFNLLQPSTFWRKELTDHVGPLDEGLHYCMDLDLWVRFLAAGYKPVLLNRELSTYRLYEQSKSCSQQDGFLRSLIEIERKYLPLLPWSQRLQVRRMMGYQHRAYVARTALRRPWKQMLMHPWWFGSQQMWKVMIRGASAKAGARHDQAA